MIAKACESVGACVIAYGKFQPSGISEMDHEPQSRVLLTSPLNHDSYYPSNTSILAMISILS